MTGRTHSLRRHVWRVVALVALAPLLLVTLAVPFDEYTRFDMVRRVDASVRNCAARLTRGSDTCVETAERQHTWVRVFDGDKLLDSHDHASKAAVSALEQLMDPGARKWLHEQDPLQRGEATTRASCDLPGLSRLRTCSAERIIDVEGRLLRIHATAGDVRSIRALSPDGVTKLVLEVLLIALVVGWWLGSRVVRPVESLRDQVLERVETGSTAPVAVDDETEVAELAHAFNTLIDDLEARRKANEAFAADLAHDLKNPVATVLSLAENMEDSKSLEGEELERYSRVLRNSGEHLNRVVQEFLDLARAEAGLEHVNREPLRLDELVAVVATRVAESPAYPETTLDIVSEAVVVDGAGRHLEMALSNVLENAFQATPSGGRVRVEVRADVNDAVVAISDEGPGLDEEAPETVFERFFTRKANGTGLGLPLARAIARAHHGDLVVESTGGSGTTFELRLPSHDSHLEMTDV